VEVQQSSNITYRVYDWGRVNENGKSRELHIYKSLDVINYEQVSLALPEPIVIEKDEQRLTERLCQNRYFTTERLTLGKGEIYSGHCDGSTLEIWGVLSGSIELNGYSMEGVKFVLLPAALGPYQISVLNDATMLRTYMN